MAFYERSFSKLRWSAVTRSPLGAERRLCLRTPADACGIVMQIWELALLKKALRHHQFFSCPWKCFFFLK